MKCSTTLLATWNLFSQWNCINFQINSKILKWLKAELVSIIACWVSFVYLMNFWFSFQHKNGDDIWVKLALLCLRADQHQHHTKTWYSYDLGAFLSPENTLPYKKNNLLSLCLQKYLTRYGNVFFHCIPVTNSQTSCERV